jgi:hypothetical protein
VALNTSKGFQSIEQHSLTFKHGKNARIKLNSNQQQRLSSTSTRTSEENLITTNINRNQADDRTEGVYHSWLYLIVQIVPKRQT